MCIRDRGSYSSRPDLQSVGVRAIQSKRSAQHDPIYRTMCAKMQTTYTILSDRHMITKLARHYSREIQIAVVTRGVTTINSFEALLREYMSINTRNNNEYMKANERQVRRHDEDKGFQKHKGVDEQKQGWQQKFSS